MNNTAELISENEAAKIARVSTSTLARFAEAGYFQVEVQGPERLYSKRALSSVFGVSFPDSSGTAQRENVIPFPQQNIPVPETQQTPVEKSLATPAAETTLASPELVETPVPAAAIDPMWGTTLEERKNEQRQADMQSAHFRQIIEMHADILSRQEREIEGLKTEREWLRRRIEKLEEKAERDQVLLLSEAQTVKQLIQMQAQRKSTMRIALEWFGIIPGENRKPVNSLEYQASPHQGTANTPSAESQDAKDTVSSAH